MEHLNLMCQQKRVNNTTSLWKNISRHNIVDNDLFNVSNDNTNNTSSSTAK